MEVVVALAATAVVTVQAVAALPHAAQVATHRVRSDVKFSAATV